MLLSVLAFISLSFCAQAVTWNVTTLVPQQGLAIQFGVPDDSPAWVPCKFPGICQPTVITVKPRTTWYWCGFQSSMMSQYWIQVQGTKGANVTTLLMRESEVQGCATPNPQNITNCGQIANSMCDTVQSCYKQVGGLVFNDDICLLVANNDVKGNSADVSIQIWNSTDRSRDIGTVFVILITVIFCLSIIAYFVIACRNEWRSPTHRLDDLLEIQQQLDEDAARDASSQESHDHDTFSAKWANVRQRFSALVSKGQPTKV